MDVPVLARYTFRGVIAFLKASLSRSPFVFLLSVFVCDFSHADDVPEAYLMVAREAPLGVPSDTSSHSWPPGQAAFSPLNLHAHRPGVSKESASCPLGPLWGGLPPPEKLGGLHGGGGNL